MIVTEQILFGSVEKASLSIACTPGPSGALVKVERVDHEPSGDPLSEDLKVPLSDRHGGE